MLHQFSRLGEGLKQYRMEDRNFFLRQTVREVNALLYNRMLSRGQGRQREVGGEYYQPSPLMAGTAGLDPQQVAQGICILCLLSPLFFLLSFLSPLSLLSLLFSPLFTTTTTTTTYRNRNFLTIPPPPTLLNCNISLTSISPFPYVKDAPKRPHIVYTSPCNTAQIESCGFCILQNKSVRPFPAVPKHHIY